MLKRSQRFQRVIRLISFSFLSHFGFTCASPPVTVLRFNTRKLFQYKLGCTFLNDRLAHFVSFKSLLKSVAKEGSNFLICSICPIALNDYVAGSTISENLHLPLFKPKSKNFPDRNSASLNQQDCSEFLRKQNQTTKEQLKGLIQSLGFKPSNSVYVFLAIKIFAIGWLMCIFSGKYSQIDQLVF